LPAPKTLFSEGSAILELRTFFEKRPKIKTLFLDENSKKMKIGRRKILLTIWGFNFLQSRGITKNLVGVSILMRSALRGLITSPIISDSDPQLIKISFSSPFVSSSSSGTFYGTHKESER